MARKSRIVSAKSSTKPSRSKRPRIAEPFQMVSSATVARDARTKASVPVLVLRGDWLKAAGFPVGTSAYLICDRQGELAVHRLGLRFPRRLVVRAKPG